MDNKKKFDFKFSYRIRTKNPNELTALMIISEFNKLKLFTDKLKFCYQFENNKTWIIGLDVEKLNERDILEYNDKLFCFLVINGREYMLEDPNKTIDIFRVGWLPHQMERKKVENFLFGHVKNELIIIDNELYSEIGINKIFNGNILFFIVNGKKEEIDRIEIGVREIDGYFCFVNRLGVKPQCLLCKQVGHIKKNCPKKSLLCEKCKGHGHLTSECNFSLAAQKVHFASTLNAPDNDMDGVISVESIIKDVNKEIKEKEKQEEKTKNAENNKEKIEKSKSTSLVKQKNEVEGKKFDFSLQKTTIFENEIKKKENIKRNFQETKENDQTSSPETVKKANKEEVMASDDSMNSTISSVSLNSNGNKPSNQKKPPDNIK